MRHPDDTAPIVFVVGAGASMPAGLPSTDALKRALQREFTQGSERMKKLLNQEIEHLYEQRPFKNLNHFEFASVLSRFADGRRVIQEHLSATLAKAKHRPLAYELIAHLGKHGFIDDLISTNFDTLLDEALLDEVGPGLSVIVKSETDVPVDPNPRSCHLVKPFGSLGEGGYRISVQDVKQFGPNAIKRFVTDHILKNPLADTGALLSVVNRPGFSGGSVS